MLITKNTPRLRFVRPYTIMRDPYLLVQDTMNFEVKATVSLSHVAESGLKVSPVQDGSE